VRTLPVSGSQESALADWIATQAYMRWPEDELEARNHMSAMLHLDKGGELAKTVYEAFAQTPMGGRCTGRMFFWMLSFFEHKPQLKAHTFNKCSFLVTRSMRGMRFHNQKEGPKNVNTVKRFWGDYKNVAHLWATFDLTFERFGYGGAPSYDDITSLHNFVTFFLSTAEYAAKVAIENRLITDWNPWRVPSDFPLAPRELNIPPPGNWLIEALKDYRAPQPL
jgi:hypothetical protein